MWITDQYDKQSNGPSQGNSSCMSGGVVSIGDTLSRLRELPFDLSVPVLRCLQRSPPTSSLTRAGQSYDRQMLMASNTLGQFTALRGVVRPGPTDWMIWTEEQ